MPQMKSSTLIGIVAVVALAIILAPVIQNALVAKPEEEPTVPGVPTQVVEAGKTAVVKVSVFDKEADSATQVATNLYAWKNGILVANGVSTSATERTDVSAATGDTLKLIAFDSSTYPYGIEDTVTVNAETVYKNIDTIKAISTSDAQIKFYYDGDVVTSLALGASEVKALDKITFKVNTNNAAYNLGMICFGLPTGTNVSDINIKSLTEVSVPQRVKDTYDYCFQVSKEGKLLEEWDTLSVDSIEIKADADGVTNETLTVAFLDVAPYIGVDQSLKYGVETDASTAVDTGISDITATLSLT